MDLEKLILKELSRRGFVRTAAIAQKTNLSRAYVQRVLRKLEEEGILTLVGRANRAHYIPAKRGAERHARASIRSIRRVLKNKNLSEEAALDAIKLSTGIFLNLPRDIPEILDYAFTEMLNNAIEHSGSKEIEVRMERGRFGIRFEIIDWGIGIYQNIMRKRRLSSELEAIQDLLKGKQTTAPKKHTGEGIFFTSKVADRLTIQGGNKRLVFDNLIGDVFIHESAQRKGTKVKFEISLSSKTKLPAVFKKYAGTAFDFNTTRVAVKLYQMDTAFISRSQARRILAGLEKFKNITLDFSMVKSAGQAFADEVVRVWSSRHPEIRIRWKNANENIEFMLRRAARSL